MERKKVNDGKKFYERLSFWIPVILVMGIIGIFLEDEEATELEGNDHEVAQVEDDDITHDDETEEEETPEDNQVEEEPEEEEKTEFNMNEKVELKGRLVEVTGIERSSGSDFNKPKDGMEYVIVSITIENNSDEELSYNPYDFKMKNSQGQIVDKSLGATIDRDTYLSYGDLAPGGSISGTIAFEQPIDDSNLVLIFEPRFMSNSRVEINLK